MSDMFDVYWREYGIAAKQNMAQMRRNAEEAQRIINELAAERDAALKKADVWKAHYIGLDAKAEFLLEELDKAHGGPFLNPVRMLASEDITVPRGPREGQQINVSERVYLEAMWAHIKEKSSYLGGWRKLVGEWKIFGLSSRLWRERAQSALAIYEEHAPGYSERAKKVLEAHRAAQSEHTEQQSTSVETDQMEPERMEHMDPSVHDKPSE